jgi:hypothetical protein
VKGCDALASVARNLFDCKEARGYARQLTLIMALPVGLGSSCFIQPMSVDDFAPHHM